MVWAVDFRKNTYISTYTYTNDAAWGAISQPIMLELGTLIDIVYVINFVKFNFDRSQGWSLVSSLILGVCLHLKSRP